jgi:hypothetical protein
VVLRGFSHGKVDGFTYVVARRSKVHLTMTKWLRDGLRYVGLGWFNQAVLGWFNHGQVVVRWDD